MMRMIVWLYKGIKIFYARVFSHITSILTRLCFRLNGIQFLGKVRSSGVPVIHMSLNSVCVIGKNFSMGNWVVNNASGVKAKSKIEVRRGAELIIGENVGITSVTIMCFDKIHIGDNVMIGVGSHIFDTNFHNINPVDRIQKKDPKDTVRTAPIIIKDNVFIGAFSIILKGVTIGKNSVVAAGSVVTKSIPDNQIWGGNPAQFIKEIEL